MEHTVVRGVEPLDQRRVAVVCRSTRVDLSLPAHVELVAVIPELVDLVRDHVRALAGPGTAVDVDSRMGATAGGSWQLSRLTGSALSVSETLAQQRVHDGDVLVLDHRPVPTPPPLFDDVLQGLGDPSVARAGTWGRVQTRRAATTAVALAAGCAAAAVLAQWWTSGGYLPPLLSGVLAVVALVAGVAARVAGAGAAVEVTAASAALGFTSLAIGTAVPGPPSAGHVLAGATAGAVLAVLLRVVSGGPPVSSGSAGHDETGGGATPATRLPAVTDPLCLAWATAASVAAAASLVVTLTGIGPAAAAAAAVVPGLVLLTAAPRIAVAAARVPVPPVPVPGDPGQADDGGPALPTPAALRARAAAVSAWLAGLVGGAGAVLVGGALVSLTGPHQVTAWSAPLAVVLVPVLLLRATTYTERAHSGLLVGWALVLVTGILVGAVLTDAEPALLVVPAAAAVAATAVVTGLLPPRAAPSPVARRALGMLEAALIASVVPVALGATGLYSLIRHR